MARSAELILDDFDYLLPKELIAQSAFHPRDSCKLLVVQGDTLTHRRFSDLAEYLEKGDVLVLNETKVVGSKLAGKKSTGGAIEVLLTKKIAEKLFACRIKGRNLLVGTSLIFPHHSAVVVSQKEDVFLVQFSREPSPQELLIPTPPYIQQPIPEEDYQTIFAKKDGSLAAPTAGLHFTPELLQQMVQQGVSLAKVSLHISAETFLPVRDLEMHQTGKEQFEIDEEAAHAINSAKRIVAVGTTVVKCLESAVWEEGKILPGQGVSELFIKPGYAFRAPLRALVTNFHLPQSSLLLLVCAYAGQERILRAYQEAIEQRYRFYSLGDAMVVVK